VGDDVRGRGEWSRAAPQSFQGAIADAGVATIRDVAARAGVGVATVSRVLNDHPAVLDQTRDRVNAAIAELDYRPSRVARALSRRRTGTIAVLVPFFTHHSAVERLRGVMAVLDQRGLEIVLFNLDHAGAVEDRFTQLARRNIADGLLIITIRPPSAAARRLRTLGVPTVVVDADPGGFPAVVVDDVAGGRLAAQHLLALGHRRIAYLGEAPDRRFRFTSSSRRLRGFSHELARAGCPLTPSLITAGLHDHDVAVRVARRLLSSQPRPTAVFAHSDTQAFGVLEAADQLGIRVPDELSVLGFDDIESARLAGLTTVRQPLHESGRLGATRLLDRLDGNVPRPRRIELPLEVVCRRTTAPPGPGSARNSAPPGPARRSA
jgi:DNA-binding LacI/PurR family transcriptional regulator